MEIRKITNAAFCKYGRIIQGYDFGPLVEALKRTPDYEGMAYEASVPELEASSTAADLRKKTYGEMPIQIGYCNGINYKLNAVEYHKSSEINVAGTDAILILGLLQDITDDYTYDTAKMEAFLIPEGCAVELYGTTLHYAPCSVGDGQFKVAIVLPAGTNCPLEEGHAELEDSLITAKNKWLIGHPEGGLAAGAHIGLTGKNPDVRECEL